MGTVTAMPARRRTGRTPDLDEAVRRFLDERDLTPGTRRVYAGTFDRLVADLGPVPVDSITTDDLTAHLAANYDKAAPATWNRVRTTIGSLFTYAGRKGWVDTNPVAAIEGRRDRPTKGQATKRRAVPYVDLDALWSRKDVGLREKALWRMLFETAARANEILGLNVEDLDLTERTAWVDGKGVGAEQVWWSTGTARLLPRLLDGRTTGPVFLADRPPTRAVAKADLDPTTGRARLSYRRAAEVFSAATGGWTLHQLRHSAITWMAEQGTDITLLKAKSRHQSIRSLERYAQPSAASVAKLTAALDPEARRRRR